MTPRSPLLVAGLGAFLAFKPLRADEQVKPAVDVSQTLSDLATRAPVDAKPDVIAQAWTELTALIQAEKLTSADHYLLASQSLANDLGQYHPSRLRYELALTAAAKGSEAADRSLAANWDSLLTRLGRPMRTDQYNFAVTHPEFADLELAPTCIRHVLTDPAKARAAAGQADNAEVKALVDADQADRKTNWATLTEEERAANVARDRERNRRMREILQGDALHTANDFTNASLVMQHSPKVSGIQLAHELAVCSLLLGDRGMGRWLVAASYDRFLVQLGHPQRFGTQFGATGLVRVDEEGICDDQRAAFGCRPLVTSRALRPL